MMISRANIFAAVLATMITARPSVSTESVLTDKVVVIEKNIRHLKNKKQPNGNKGKGKAVKKSKFPKLQDDKFWTMADLISIDSKPELTYAIGHRGFGRTRRQDTVRDIPTENTIESVVKAFQAGVRVVEVDVVITADGDAFVDHDDYLLGGTFTCLNKLSTKELETIMPESSTLKNLLDAVRPYAKRKDEDIHPSGLVIVEIIAPTPLCDPLDESEGLLVEAVFAAVRDSKMVEQVKITAFSPSVLQLAGSVAPEIDRIISLNALQLLSVEEASETLGVEVVPIDKDIGLGLQWVAVYPQYRNVGYNSIAQFLETAVALGSTTLEIGKRVLFQMEAVSPGAGAALVAQLQSVCFFVNVWTAETVEEWPMIASMGVNGIYTDFIEEGVALQGK